MTKHRFLALLSTALPVIACSGPDGLRPDLPSAPREDLGPIMTAPGGVFASRATSAWLPIAWEMPAGSCPALPEAVAGQGESHVVVQARDNGDGTLRLHITNNVHGTATDTSGNRYSFNYTQNTSGITSAVDPIPPFEVHVVDHFNLVGAGQATQMHVGFVLDIAVDADGNVTVFEIKQRNPAGCDPI